MKKQRLDIYLIEAGLVDSRSKARALIMAGKVRVNGVVVDKAGYPVTAGAAVEVDEPPPFVSRGGLKLVAALDGFGIDPTHRVCADVGASTGGFTDVLLQRGARRVYALDVGYGQLAWKLRQDPRVVVMERTNARYVDTLPEPVELVTIDVSFISLNLILPVVARWFTDRGEVVALVKPQFEAGREQVGKGGVVRDRKVHRQVLEQVLAYAVAARLQPRGLMPSPITGPAGNHEFLLYLDRSPDAVPTPDPAALVENCLSRLPSSSKD